MTTSDVINPPATDFRSPVVPPEFNEAARLQVLEAITGFSSTPDPELDRFSGKIQSITDGTWQGVNRIGKQGKQFFPGLAIKGLVEIPDEYREMDHDHGFCRHVEERGKALLIQDTLEIAPHSTNPVVVKFGVRAYAGVPLFLPDRRFVGTLWSINMEEPRKDWGMSHISDMEELGHEVLEYMLRNSPDFQ